MEYREKLYKAFQGSQTRYLERKGAKKVYQQKNEIISLNSSESDQNNLYTVFPKNPNLALQKRKMTKETRGVEKDVQFKKHIQIENARVSVESINNKERGKTRWHDKRCEFRVAMLLEVRNFHPVYFYTDDLNEAKALSVRLNTAGSQRKYEIQESIQQIAVIEPVMRFFSIWTKINLVYEKRLLRMISFQLMGINLIEVASTAWFHRERMFKFWSNKVLKRQKKPVLISTFKFGQIKQHPDALSYKASLLIRENIKKLINLFRNRRLVRHQAIQKKIDLINAEQERGIFCSDIKITRGNITSNIKQGRVKIEGQQFLQLEEDNNINVEGDDTFFEDKCKPFKFSLDHIAYLATNFNPKSKVKKDVHTIRIYGRTISEKYDSNQTKNLAPCELNLDIHRRIPPELYQVIIHSIEIPIALAKKLNSQADVRVKLSSAQSSQTQFYVKSKPFRVELPQDDEQIKGKPTFTIDCENFVFTLDKIKLDDENEQFMLDILLNRSSVPLKAIMKELIYDEVIKGEKTIKYLNQKSSLVSLKDPKGNDYKVKFSVNKGKNANNIIPHYREGNRLLVGKYILYNKSKPCVVKSLNRDGTVDLMIQTKEFPNIKLEKVTLIEKYGVNMYDLDNLPYMVQNSQHSWVIEYQTKNKRLLNIIHQGIRNRQADLTLKKRFGKQQGLLQTEIEGKLLISVIEGRNLQTRGECNPFVKISLTPKFYDKKGAEKQTNIEKLQFETHAVMNSHNPLWVNEEYPVGRLFDLGTFYKDKESLTITFEVQNQTQTKKEKSLGTSSLETVDLLDVYNPAQEKCLILSGGPITYGFLIIQSYFIPKKHTRLKYEIIEDLTLFKSPEQYLHYKYLLKQQTHDTYNYLLPIQKYQPAFVEYCLTLIFNKNQDPNVTNAQILQHNYNDAFKSPLLLSQDKTPDKASSPYLIQLKNVLCMPDEKIAAILKLVNSQRPEIEEGLLVFKYLWKYRFWQQFLEEINGKSHKRSISALSYLDQIDAMEQDIVNNDESFSLNTNRDRDYQRQSAQLQGSSSKPKWFWQKEGDLESYRSQDQFQSIRSSNQINNNAFELEELQNNPLMKQSLILKSIWENENDQRYADVFHLVQQGIPESLRVTIWKDLLSVPFIEYQETKIFQKKYNLNYDSSKSLYLNYRELALKNDCLSFRQIDEDIENFDFPPHYSSNKGMLERVIELNQQKRKMRNILRVLMLWSKTKKIDNKLASFSYTKGLIYILQRFLSLCHSTNAKNLQVVISDNEIIQDKEEEDAFWLLNGLIRPIPKLFSIDISCLEGGRTSVMRNEMTIFKAILKENLPKICDKLRIMGLPVEYLIYDHIGSFYSNIFQSEIVYRLWDIIIFNMSTKNKADRKRALWYIMSPAYLLFREKQEEILACTSVQQILDVYKNAGSLTYNPDWVISQLRALVKDIFVIGADRVSKEILEADKGSALKVGLSMFNNFINKQKAMFTADKAQLLEQTRQNYEKDLSEIFTSIEQENKQVGLMLEASSSQSQSAMKQMQSPSNFTQSSLHIQKQQSQQQSYLDYMKWRTHIMHKFRRIALKQGFDNIADDLYEFDEPDINNRENLDLSKINICIHQIQHLWGAGGLKVFGLKIYYGKNVKEDQEGKGFQSLEFYDSGDVFNSKDLMQMFHVYDYMESYNCIKIEILDQARDDEVACELLIDLRDISANRFVKKWFQMRNEGLLDNVESFRFPFTTMEISFFLQSHTAIQHKEMMQNRNAQMSQFINSIKRKLPDRIDIFNKKNETDFVNMMKGDFQRIIKEEQEALQCFLPLEQAKNTINDNYNFISQSDFGDISLNNLQYLVQQCFFQEWMSKLGDVYSLFIKEKEAIETYVSQSKGKYILSINKYLLVSAFTPQVSESKTDEVRNSNYGTNMFGGLLSGFKATPSNNRSATPGPSNVKRNNFEEQKEESDIIVKAERKLVMSSGQKVPFSLRNFLVSLVLMSHCTMNEKFDILYDLFDWNDGVADGLDINSIFLLLKTIFERNLYYWPSHELFNIIEQSFDSSVSMIYLAYWTKDQNVSANKKSLKLQSLLDNPSLAFQLFDNNESSMMGSVASTIDVTLEVQDTLSSYHRMFGTKNIDFNADSSVFKKLEFLIKSGKELLKITNKIQSEEFDVSMNSERFKKESNSNNNKYRLVLFCEVSGERFTHEVFYDKDGVIVKNRDLIEKDDLDEYLKRNINKIFMQGRSSGVSKIEFMEQTEQIPFLHDLVRVETFYRDRIQNTLKKKKKLEEEIIILMNISTLQLIFKFQTKVMKNVEGELVKMYCAPEDNSGEGQYGFISVNAYKVLMTGCFEEDVIADLRERMIAAINHQILSGEESIKKAQQQWNILQMLQGTWNFMYRDTNKNSDQKWRKAKEFERLVKFQGQSHDNQIVFKLEKQKLQQLLQGGSDKQLILQQNNINEGKIQNLEQQGYDCFSLYKHQDQSYEWRLCKIVHKETIPLDRNDKRNNKAGQQKQEQQRFYYWIDFLHLKQNGIKMPLKRKREEILISARYAREQQRNYEQEALKFIKETYQQDQLQQYQEGGQNVERFQAIKNLKQSNKM